MQSRKYIGSDFWISNYLSFGILIQAEAKCEVLQCYEKMLIGLSSAASSGFKDIFKACKACLGLKSYGVRCAAAKVSQYFFDAVGLEL